MLYRHLGNSGLEVSEVGIGTNNFGGRMDYRQTQAVIHAALDAGINLFDTADIYSAGVSERYIGRALAGGQRHRAVIATKFGMKWADGPHGQGGSRKRVTDGVEGSLTRLQTDYIDLFQMHRWDAATPIEETLRALDDLVKAGKVRYIGCSNFSGWQIVESAWTAKTLGLTPFVSAQPEYSLLVRDAEKEVFPACEKYGLGVLPYFPLAMGFLTGKYKRGTPPSPDTRLGKLPAVAAQRRLTDANFDVLERLEKFAGDRGHTVHELAFAGLLGRPVISSVIAGASTPEQVAQNAKAADWRLTADDMKAVEAALKG
jgi:aryl-alcohol dehydrogenase-like predicted oxidoreductase